MSAAIVEAKAILSRLLVGIPADRLHLAVFTTVARELHLPAGISGNHGIAKAALDAVFAPFTAGGGTDYTAPVRLLTAAHPPTDDEDVILLFVGDEAHNCGAPRMADACSQVKNLAGFALVKVPGEAGQVVEDQRRGQVDVLLLVF